MTQETSKIMFILKMTNQTRLQQVRYSRRIKNFKAAKCHQHNMFPLTCSIYLIASRYNSLIHMGKHLDNSELIPSAEKNIMHAYTHINPYTHTYISPQGTNIHILHFNDSVSLTQSHSFRLLIRIYN